MQINKEIRANTKSQQIKSQQMEQWYQSTEREQLPISIRNKDVVIYKQVQNHKEWHTLESQQSEGKGRQTSWSKRQADLFEFKVSLGHKWIPGYPELHWDLINKTYKQTKNKVPSESRKKSYHNYRKFAQRIKDIFPYFKNTFQGQEKRFSR